MTNTAYISNSPQPILDALDKVLGPRPPFAHIADWRHHQWTLDAPARKAALNELGAEIGAEHRAKQQRSRDYGAQEFCNSMARMHAAWVASRA